jgi:TetR/AcrR family transcriptional regulator, fatty acid metabolism regulator protein
MKGKTVPQPTRRSDRGRDIRRKIIEAAVKLFAKKGFFETTVDDIARRARIAKGTVYIYFKDKSSLYAGIIDDNFTGAIRFLKETEAKPISNTDKLRIIADDWIGNMLKVKDQFPMFTMENVDMSRKILRGIHETAFGRIGEVVAQIARIIKSGVAAGEFRKIDPQIGAVYFLNSIRTVFQVCTLLPECREPEKQMMDLLFHGLIKENE